MQNISYGLNSTVQNMFPPKIQVWACSLSSTQRTES
jgi:hypothetical protein